MTQLQNPLEAPLHSFFLTSPLTYPITTDHILSTTFACTEFPTVLFSPPRPWRASFIRYLIIVSTFPRAHPTSHMPTMTSSPQLLVHDHRQPAKPVVVHHPNPKRLNRRNDAVSSGEFFALVPAIEGLPLQSRAVVAGCDSECSDCAERPVITYGFAEPRYGPLWSPQEWRAEYKVPRPLRSIPTKRTNKRSTATPSSDDCRIESKRVRTPPPAPRPQRLPTPDLSDLECDTFCNCCKSTNENARLVKAKSRKSSKSNQEMV